MMKIGYVNPTFYSRKYEPLEKLLRQTTKTAVRKDTEVDILWLDKGYSDPDYPYPEAYNRIQMAKKIYQIEKKGYDAAIVGCFLDPGLREARSIVSIPVAGACESAIYFAASLGAKFSIILISPQTEPYQTDYIRSITPKLASVIKWELQAPEAVALYSDPQKLIKQFNELSIKAIKEDGAEVIVPACTIISTLLTINKIHKIEEVPIIDPVIASIQMVENLVDLRRNYGIEVCRSTIYNPAVDIIKEIPID